MNALAVGFFIGVGALVMTAGSTMLLRENFRDRDNPIPYRIRAVAVTLAGVGVMFIPMFVR